ncbi:MAG: hypothetical protein NZU63_11565, partial [Gemmataceae bacterium]|nr:hypothetical protein [Gemmataceae bacterium]MDW8243849.1 hypothetical protein [Thermogemmata sp.]
LGPPGLVNPGDAISINTVAQQFIVAHSPISTSNWAVTLSYNVSGSFSPSNQILLYFDSLDLNMLITLTVTTTSGNLTATYNIVTPGPTLDFTVALPFSSLAGPGNLANTTGISITFNSGNIPDVDFVLFGKDRGIQLTW